MSQSCLVRVLLPRPRAPAPGSAPHVSNLCEGVKRWRPPGGGSDTGVRGNRSGRVTRATQYEGNAVRGNPGLTRSGEHQEQAFQFVRGQFRFVAVLWNHAFSHCVRNNGVSGPVNRL